LKDSESWAEADTTNNSKANIAEDNDFMYVSFSVNKDKAPGHSQEGYNTWNLHSNWRNGNNNPDYGFTKELGE